MPRSPLADAYPSDEGTYTELQVLRSAAGWYVGTMFHHHDDSDLTDTPGLTEPGSRDSQYFVTKEEAEEALRSMSFQQREEP